MNSYAAMMGFPFLFGGTFIEGLWLHWRQMTRNFPSFSEGLSLRVAGDAKSPQPSPPFPFLFGGTFIEGNLDFFLVLIYTDFPSFSEGLSLRVQYGPEPVQRQISLPFRRDFH